MRRLASIGLAVAAMGFAVSAMAAEPFEGPAAVTASSAPGFYAEPVTVELAYPDADAEIHYTLDGSEPTAATSATCFRYTSPLVFNDASSQPNRLSLIKTTTSTATLVDRNYKWTAPTANLSKANVLRARAFKGALACTNEFAGTWLVGPTVNEHRLRVVSLLTDEDNFFGSTRGIMMPGNYNQRGTNWERRVHFELFETNRERTVDCDLGTRIHGANSRNWPQKTLCFYARDEYGKKRVKYPLFPDDANTNYKRFLLRNSGNDWNFTTFRDAVSQGIFRPVAKHSTQGYVPSVVYINGEYWGILNFRHQYGARFFEREFGADPDNVDYVKYVAGSGQEAAEGDLVAYNELVAYMNSHSSTSAEVYAEMERRIDIDNLIDYCLLHAYLAVGDWANNAGGNNVGLWRERVAYTNDAALPHDGRWRFCSYDTDSGSSLVNENKSTDGIAYAKKLSMFSFLCAYTNFTHRFVNRSADMLNTVFLPERAQAKVDEAMATIASEIPRHVVRWPNLVSTTAWSNKVATMRAFFGNRPSYMRNHLISHFSAGTVQTLNLAAVGQGRVQVNTLSTDDPVNPIALPWSGQYFSNIPVTLQATPQPGCEFAGWVIGGATNTAPTISLAVTGTTSVTAVFREWATPTLAINEVMADSQNGDWFEIFNSGTHAVNLRGCWLRDDSVKHLTRIPCDVEIPPGGFLVVRAADDFTPGLNSHGELLMPFGLGKKGDEVHLYSWDGETELASVVFGAQATDIAQGWCPDGSENWGVMGVATPGAPNRGPLATGLCLATGVATQMWAGTTGRLPLHLPEGAVATIGFTLEGGEEFSARIRLGNFLQWRVPIDAPAGTYATVKVTWEGELNGEPVHDETTCIITSLGRRPVVPVPEPEPVLETVFATGDVWGTFNKSVPASMTHVTTANQLAFPGAKLEEFLDCEYWGWMDGAHMEDGYGQGYFIHPHRDSNGDLQSIVATVQKYDDKYVKGVVVKLTQGDDGVYVQGLTAIYRETSSGNVATTDFVKVGTNGEVSYQNYTQRNTIATSPNVAAYGLACFNAVKWLKSSTAVTVGPGLTVDDVKDCEFSAVFAGSSSSPNNYTRVPGRNIYVTYDQSTGQAVKLRMEMQILSDGWIKCCVVELTNGADGVQATIVKARYVSASSASLGYEFVKSDGSYNGNSGTVAAGPTSSGYIVGGLRAQRWVQPEPSRTTVIIFR